MAEETLTPFGAVVRRIIGSQRLRSVAIRGGISHSLLYDMLQGWVPSFKKLAEFAGRLQLDDGLHRELFEAAGYSPVAAVEADAGNTIGEHFQRLRPDQQEVVRRLLERPERIDAVRVLVGMSDRVSHALAVA